MWKAKFSHSILGGVLLLTGATPHAVAQTATGSPGVLEEIVVTASKREESIRNVPMTITAFSGDELIEMGAVNFDDYAVKVPGLGFANAGPAGLRGSGPSINVRGIGGTGGESATGYYIGETPIPSQNLKLFDISRIEVLKGPQGTLYGARTYGGLVKVVPNKANTEAFAANASLGLSNTERGGANWSANAAVNLPVSDRFAIRAVGYYVDNSGFIDSVPMTNAFGGVDLDNIIRDSNGEETRGGRLSFVWQPSDVFDAELNALYEDQAIDNNFMRDTWLRDNFGIEGALQGQTEPARSKIHNYNMVLNFHRSRMDITSSTSYFERDSFNLEDRAATGNIFVGLATDPAVLNPAIDGLIAAGQLPPGTTIATPLPILDFFSVSPNTTDSTIRDFTQEIRLLSSSDGPFKWLVGGFYQERTSSVFFYGEIPGIVEAGTLTLDVPGAGLVPFPLFSSDRGINRVSDQEIRELGVFGEVTYQFAEAWDATIGLRWFDTRFSQTQTDLSTSLFVPTIVPPTPFDAAENGVNPKFALSYRPTDTALLFVSATKGFRIGGVTNTATATPSAGCAAVLAEFGVERGDGLPYDSDSLWTYELGAKTAWAAGRVQLDTTLFYNDWTDLQQGIFVPACGTGFLQNAGAAESKGVEVEISALLTEGLTLGVAFGWMDSEITESDVFGLPEGTPFTLAPDFKGAANLTYQQPLAFANGRWSFFGRADYSYQDGTLFDFNDSIGSVQPSYSTLDLRFGLTSERWDVIAFVDNVTDEDAILFDYSLASGFPVPVGSDNRRVTPLRPTTYGLTFTVRY